MLRVLLGSTPSRRLFGSLSNIGVHTLPTVPPSTSREVASCSGAMLAPCATSCMWTMTAIAVRSSSRSTKVSAKPSGTSAVCSADAHCLRLRRYPLRSTHVYLARLSHASHSTSSRRDFTTQRRRLCSRTLLRVEAVASSPSPQEQLQQSVPDGSQFSPVLVVRRIVDIGLAGLRYYVAAIQADLEGGDIAQKKAAALRQGLTELGPAYIKIGQAISSREDLVSPQLIAELSKLQDRLPPFPDAEAFAAIEKELGVRLEEVFSEISPQSIAAASLGQVYKATLKDGGDTVAVKVQRPNVSETVALDLYIIKRIAVVLRKYAKVNSDLGAIVDEWNRSIQGELDYLKEAANGEKFRELYGEFPGVKVPKMYSDLSSKKVLIMEWVDGERLGLPGAGDETKYVEIGVACSLAQLLDEGVYHADPHPGNLLKTPDGRLAYLDFGMLGEVEGSVRTGLIKAAAHLVNREFDALANDFRQLGFLPPDADLEAATPALTGVFKDAVTLGIRNLSFTQLSGNLGRTMYQYGFRIMPFYYLVIRCLAMLEGIAVKNDPNFKVLGAAYPFIAERMLLDESDDLQEALSDLLYSNGKFRYDRLESLISNASDTPKSLSRVAIAGGDDSHLEGESGTTALALRLLLGSTKSSLFVRQALTEEAARVLDSGTRVLLDGANASLTQTIRSVGLPLPPRPPKAATVEDLDILWEAEKVFNLIQSSSSEQANAVVTTSSAGEFTSRMKNRLLAAEVAIAKSIDEGQGVVEREQKEQELLLEELRELAAKVSSSTGGSSSLSSEQAQRAFAIFNKLSPEMRQQALDLPIQITSRFTSRIAARSIRWLLDMQN